MALNDPISNMLTAIRNGQQVRLAQVKCPSSKMRRSVLEVLKKEGFIKDFAESEVRPGVKEITVDLKYFEGEPVIKKIDSVSKPGRRIYKAISDLQKVHNGLGVSILSTSKGVMADHEARTNNVGGEIICNVF